MTVLVGGLPTMYASSGVVGVPAGFLLITPILLALLVGYVAVTQQVPHPAAFYAVVAQGISPTAGIAAGFVGLLGYNAIGISLYGLLGYNLSQLAGSWWVWASAALAFVTLRGLRSGGRNAKIMGCFLALELGVLLVYVLAAFASPARGHVEFASLSPAKLLVSGVAIVLVFMLAAMTGTETPGAHGEEAQPGAARRATLIAAAVMGPMYALLAWAMAVHAGSDHVVDSAGAFLAGHGPGPLELLGAVYGSAVTHISNLILVTSIVTAMIAFHSTGARYTFGMAREGVLPKGWAAVGRGERDGAPWAASLVQTVIASGVIGGWVVLGWSPMVLFTWLSTIGAVSILTLLVVSSVAALKFFNSGAGGNEGVFVRRAAPMAGLVFGFLVLAMALTNVNALLSLPPDSHLSLLVPGVIVAVAVIGAMWGRTLRRDRPQTWQGTGATIADPVTADVTRLHELEM
ncbi:APC family permease [Hamadaea tsunoensis]|uniref:APC family permease n=1 Tax=Hamadaea tsunoensis TaxID=53368 RepID=UPI00146FB108|nr:APC family permease [Hamadaea tsunoensis]